MTRYFAIILLIIVVFSSDIFCQSPGYNVPSRKKKEEKEQINFTPDFEFMLSFAYQMSSAYYDSGKNLVTDLLDSVTIPGITRTYTFNLKRYTFDFKLDYFATKDLKITAKAPLTFYYLDEIFLEYIDTVNLIRYMRGNKEQLTHTRIDYIGLSSTYSLFDSTFINRYSAEIRIPTGSTSGVYNDPQKLWSDGAFEFLTGLSIGYSGEKSTIEIGARYNYRAEDMTDRILGNLYFNLHSVPDTKFYGFVEGAYNISGANDNTKFNIRQMPWQDEYLDAGFGFEILVSKRYLGDFNYRIRLDGKNAWNQATYFINFAYRF
jgi:hypothetical protein